MYPAKSFVLLLTILSVALQAAAQSTPSWLRYPSISPDGQTIVFTYKGDLWKVPAAGGTATPLTLHEAHDFMPVWSPDGKSIAFASDRYGNFDVFLIPATGGQPKRLTYHSADELPYDFTPDGQKVLFGSVRQDVAANRQFPTSSQPELYQVPITSGRVAQVLSTPAEDARYSQDGSQIIYHDKKGGENAWRKHQTSSIARDLWLYDSKTKKHTKLTTFNGEDRNPILAGQTVYYLSESSGSFNVHQMTLSNSASSQPLTTFKKHPVRFLSRSGEGTLCFSYDGELYTLKPNGTPQKVPVQIATDVRSNNEKVLSVSGGARDMAVSPNGKEVAFIFRGEVFVSAVEGGVTKRITNTPEQERGVRFSPDGKALLYASERGNSWKIYETRKTRDEEPYFYASTVLKETALIDNTKENYQPEYSPDGKEIAYIEDRMTLKVFNIASKKSRTLLTDRELFSMRDNDQYFQWSPDGKWLLFDYSVPGLASGEVGLIAADGKGKVLNLTQNGFQDYRAKWVPGGKMMLWFSNRDGLRSQAQSGNSQADVYALFFTQEAFDQFNLNKEDAALLKEQQEKATKADSTKKKEAKKDTTIVIDWDGLTDRKAKLTIHSSSLADALLSKDGETLYYLARFEKGHNLWSTNLRTKETKQVLALNAGGGSLEWDKDQKNIFLNADGKILKIDPEKSKQETVSIKGEVLLDVAAERQFMFEHVWRRTKETFYTASMHGVDWDSYKPDYARYLPHVGTNHEFAELLSELLGELNVSHSGARYVTSAPTDDATASLGAFYDYTHQGNGVRIEEVLKGGPLDKAKLSIRPGMIIEAIDGEPITPERDLAQYLNRKADQNTLLSILDGTTRRAVVVKPVSLSEESRLLYKRWVKRNQDEVEKLSQGTLGYVHIPGMNDGAYRTTYEEIMGKYAGKKGIVVDTRFNGGGDLVADLAMFLSGKQFMDYTTDTRSSGYEPNFRWTKPSVSLANEANYSDGHCYAFMVQDQQVNKLVGQPVPGTCTFAGWEVLQDNSVRWGVPPLGVKAMTGQYLENAQTEPDYAVWNDYDAVVQGKDAQLEKAVEVLLGELK
ncbi:S41 family peptidase [Rhabdobacter roseus]|uniref:Tricorn protease homolog n=1 Tax=Rhabdobacter roseus TaxID=1655419 RepID=A0A840TFT7_9BACT|nr:S41 family peptidase [Rhabdobacter roseus]MBB5282041.1 Tol biopolymer transport system component/C-terminal processing protease CtpA/Prc [Rhabdobacter roseus]